MLRKNRIGLFAVTAVAASLLVGGLVVGSNMGFKMNLQLTRGVAQWVSIPYISPYANADAVLTNTMPAGGTVTRFLPTNPPSQQFWTGTLGTNFAVVGGEGYQLTPTGTIGTTYNVIIVGSHDPFQTVPAGGFIASRDYLVSIPYHTTFINAGDVLADLPSAGTVTRLLKTSPPSVQFWTGSLGTNFGVVLGEAYNVRVVSNSPGFLPAHF